MRLNSKLLGIALFIIAACSTSSFNETANKKLSDFFETHQKISATYAIIHGDEIIKEGAQGFFDKTKQIKLVKDQKMPIASGTKQMTAAMILRLQERGVLTVQDTLVKFLPADSGWWPNNKLPVWAYKVSLHQLLTHTSGIAEYIPTLKFDISEGHDKINHLIAVYAANTPLTNQPGESYSYSNTGYFFLGVIIEILTKQDIASVFKNEFFDPLKMHDTHMASFDEAIKFQQGQMPDFPKRYFGIPTNATPTYVPAQVDFYVVPFADGGVVSTASDLIKWNRAFHGGKVVSEYSYKLMTTPYNDAHDIMVNNVKSGYGVYIHHLPDGQVVYYHEGRAIGIRSEHGYIPSSNLYFAILSNVMLYEPDEIKDKVDYTNISNQFDIVNLRGAIWDLVTKEKR